jgi:NAD(P)-dependent dehydrogenase (short-subunit alcohol dehydrogenase family)
MRFQNKVVIVSGAGSGIGKAIALGYGKEGAKVIVAEIDSEAGKKTVDEINENGGQSLFVRCDVGNPTEIEAVVLKAEEVYGEIHILINNAGISKWESPYNLHVEEWDRILNTNLRSVFLFSREVAKVMRRKRSKGSIVNISSTRALMSEPNSEAYAASKGGVVAITHALAASLSEDLITVNAISPGWIEIGDYQALREIDHKQHLSQRVGKPEDIVKACFYLTHSENDFVTGTNLIVDGGMTRKMIYQD